MNEPEYLTRAKSWLDQEYDEDTRNEVMHLLTGDQKDLEDRFYRMLEFGTGGLRGIMGTGTNRMNKYTVSFATQGLAEYIIQVFPEGRRSVVISYDSRHNSRDFAMTAARVLLSNGIRVFVFDNIRPTPELSFAIRYLKCSAGIMITASHNPKEYNGYKVFWEDGAQIITPHDKLIIGQVRQITSPLQVKYNEELYPEPVGEEIDNAYLKAILSMMPSTPASIARQDLAVVYTPLHGTGVRLIPEALRRMGVSRLFNVPAQDLVDGDFPTVVSPNPEETAAMKMALERAEEVGAGIVLASDPDADRVGLAVRDDKGHLVLLNGNQTASILTSYILTRRQEQGRLNTASQYCVKTIVTTELIAAICEKFGVKLYNVLTGFKYIEATVRANEGKATFICGGEESYGFNIGEFVRDKDAVVTCAMIADCAAWLASKGKTIYGYLQEIYAEFGYHAERLLSLKREGKDGVEAIRAMMQNFRTNPPKDLAGSPVVRIVDYLEPEKTGLPSSDVLQFFAEDGTVVSVRPSGTEPKIKFYFGARGEGADARIDTLCALYGAL